MDKLIQLALADFPRADSLLNGPRSGISLGGLFSDILSVVFGIAGIVAFIWALFGVFQYITAGGSKEGLAKARGRITWVFIGIVFLIISFSLAKYVQNLFQVNTIQNLPPISSPPPSPP